MPRMHTKAEKLSGEVFRRKTGGERKRERAERDGLTLKRIKKLITRRNSKAQKIAKGYISQLKGRPRKNSADEESRRKNALGELRMEVGLPRNFLPEGRKG